MRGKVFPKKLNYEVDFRVLSSNNFGVPQKRERVYIVGFNRDKIKATNEVPKKIFDDLEKSKELLGWEISLKRIQM